MDMGKPQPAQWQHKRKWKRLGTVNRTRVFQGVNEQASRGTPQFLGVRGEDEKGEVGY